MATKEAIFEAWAPAEGRWSAFVKPVLFAYVAHRKYLHPPPRSTLPVFDVASVFVDSPTTYRRAARRTNTALIVDLPGPESVGTGVLLAREGFRPVPLFNSIPADASLVDVWPTVLALEHFAADVQAANVPENAPPAFLLDSHRGGRPFPGAGIWFDNRAVCFTTDFPSAAALSRAGIERVVVVHARGIGSDLLEVLVRWSREGIETFETTLDHPPKPIRITMLDLFGRLAAWYDRIALHRNEDGAFGRRVQAVS